MAGDWKQAQIYIKSNQILDWEKFKEICKREGQSHSEKILKDFVQPYVQTHGDGNPQTLIEFAESPRCLPLWKTCKSSGKKMDKGEFYCSKVHLLIDKKTCELRNGNESKRGKVCHKT